MTRFQSLLAASGCQSSTVGVMQPVFADTAGTTGPILDGQQRRGPWLARSYSLLESMGLVAKTFGLPPPTANPRLRQTMSELVPSEIIESLEKRHEHLIAELDELNERIEKALSSFTKPSEELEDAAAESDIEQVRISKRKEAGLSKTETC